MRRLELLNTMKDEILNKHGKVSNIPLGDEWDRFIRIGELIQQLTPQKTNMRATSLQPILSTSFSGGYHVVNGGL